MRKFSQFVAAVAVAALLSTIATHAEAAIYHGSGGPLVDATSSGRGTADFSIVISGTGATIQSVNAVIMTDLTHTWFGDTEFRLLSPDGTPVLLASPRSGESANLNGTYTMVEDLIGTYPTLDEAAVPLGDSDDIPSGTYAIATFLDNSTPGPRTTYAPFAGKAADGTWTLRVLDFGQFDTGALGSWSLDVTFVPEPGSLGLLAAAGLLALRRRPRCRCA